MTLAREHKVEALKEDFLDRDQDNYVKIRRSGRLGWESLIPAGGNYSDLLRDCRGTGDVIREAYGMARDYILTKVFKRQLDIEDAERKAARDAREWELERQREETERLRAEGKTEKNVNTSKKKIQANEKQKSDERKAALDRADRAARRERDTSSGTSNRMVRSGTSPSVAKSLKFRKSPTSMPRP